MDFFFNLLGPLVLPFWLLIIVLPHWRWTRRIMASPLVIVPVALVYAGILLTSSGPVTDFVGMLVSPSLAQIAPLLGSETGATLSWLHFGAFDLFVGRWVYLDSRERNFTAWLISPLLIVVFTFGPFGFLLYLIAREVLTRVGGEAAAA